MMIKVGDKVKFINDVGGGIVTGFIGKNMVNVENEDGFEVPYPVSMLLNVDDPSLNRGGAVAEKPAVEETPKPVKDEKPTGKVLSGKDSPDFYFAVVPFDSKNPVGGDIDLYLVNDSNFRVMYRYGHFKENAYHSAGYGMLEPNSKEELETVVPDDLSDLPEFYFQLMYFRDKENEPAPAISKKIRINPVKFYKEKSFQPNAFFKKNAMVYQITENVLHAEMDKLTDDDFREVVKAKEKPVPAKIPSKPRQPDIIEIDLHINELIDNSAGLSNKEILDIQMDKVESEMRTAIQSRAKRIVFIHGVGQGVLKQEVARMLRSKFPKYAFQDASFKEYGYGATLVLLRKK